MGSGIGLTIREEMQSEHSIHLSVALTQSWGLTLKSGICVPLSWMS